MFNFVLRTLLNKLLKNNFIKSVTIIASGTALGQVALLLASPVLTRLYSPEDFGLFAIFNALMGTVSIISSLRFEYAIPLCRSNIQVIQLMIISFCLNFLFVCLLGLIILNNHIHSYFNIKALNKILIILPLGVLLVGNYKILNFVMIRGKEYKIIGYTKFIQSIATIFFQLLIAIFNINNYGLIIGYVLGQGCGTYLLFKKFKFLFKSKIKFQTTRILSQFKRYHRFFIYDAPASLVNTLSDQLPQLLLAFLFSPNIAGFYMLANRVLMAPLALVSQSVGQVIYGSSKEKLQNGRLGTFTSKLAFLFVISMVIPCIVLWLYSQELFIYFFGNGWREAGKYAAWMILGISMQFVYSPLSVTLLTTQSQHINLILQTMLLFFRLVFLLWGYYSQQPIIAIIGYSAVGFIGYGIGTLVLIYNIYKTEKKQKIKRNCLLAI